MGKVIENRVFTLQEELGKKEEKISKLKTEIRQHNIVQNQLEEINSDIVAKLQEAKKQITSLTEENETLRKNNLKLTEENQHLKKWLEDPESLDRVKNPRGAGRKTHDETWQESYNLYKVCFERGYDLKQAEDHVNMVLDACHKMGGITKFSKSTYYRFKKYYTEEDNTRFKN